VGAGVGAGVGRTNRGRKKRSDNTKKIEGREKHRVKEKEIIITKPVIESTNPFFIAVCAPETYKPRISTPLGEAADNGKFHSGNGSGSGNSFIDDRDRDRDRNRGVKTNVFLRHRNRNTNTNTNTNSNTNTNNIYPNRFIHHPLLQQSRESDILNSHTQNDTTNASTNIAIELSNEELFPSLSKASVPVSSSGPTLNFKEMVMRNAVSVSTTTSTTTSGSREESRSKESVSILPPPPTYPRVFLSSQKTISSSNIFLAAFQNNDDDNDNDFNDDYNNDYNEPGSSYMSSSALIDSCDKKYDRLYSS
jgi:hypothetical protein